MVFHYELDEELDEEDEEELEEEDELERFLFFFTICLGAFCLAADFKVLDLDFLCFSVGFPVV